MRNIIKNILKEEIDSKSERVKSIVNKYGIERALEMVVGGKETIRNAYQDNPSEYLNQFNNLTPVEKDNIIYYVDEDKMPLFQFYSDNTNKYVYINVRKIWMFFYEIIGLKYEYEEIQHILINWLEEVYNIKGLIPLPLVMSVPIL
jgi:hypothetical protein